MPPNGNSSDDGSHPSPASGLRLALRVLDATAPLKSAEPGSALPKGRMLFGEAMELVETIVSGLNAGLFPVLGIEDETARWQQTRRRALLLLESD